MASPTLESNVAFEDLMGIQGVDANLPKFGVSLGLDTHTVDEIIKNQPKPNAQKREVFRRVLFTIPNLKWKDVLDALIAAGCKHSAERMCSIYDWQFPGLNVRSLSGEGYYSDESPVGSTSQLMLESLRPPESEEGNAASMSRSASYSRSVETDSDEFHSAPSAGDDLGLGNTISTQKSLTTNFGAPVGAGYISSKSATRPRSELQTPFFKSFRSDLMEAQSTLSMQPSMGARPMESTLSYDLRERLRLALRKGDLDTLKAFLESLDNVDTILTEKGETALMIASKEGHKEIVKYLLDKKASVSHKDVEGATVLFVTASIGNYEILKLLINSNPRAVTEINTKNRFGVPILMDPASKGFSMVSEYLLENGAKPNDTNKDGVTPLYRACEKGQKEVVKVLIEHKADVVQICPKTSKTPLQESVDREHSELVPILVKALKKVNEKNARLFMVTTVEQLRSLVNNGADLDSREKNGATPLMVHTKKQAKEMVQELIRLKANVDLQDNDGFSALMIAARQGDAVIVQIFIGASAILDFKEKERGHTALMLATIGMFTKVVKELVLARADINIRSRDGRTALDIAKELKCTEIIDLLTPTQSHSSGGDPFVDLLSTYLARKEGEAQAPKIVKSAPAGRGSHKTQAPLPVSGQRDESSELRDELKKSYRRIADLETRIHDLTLQIAIEVPSDGDLSYMDRERLETEFRKNKELKKKAEQYAIEAKQTAQRLSAENFKLKEDLSKERHHNELTRKNMLREMEQKVDRQAVASDLLDAKREVFEREISQRAMQLLRTMPRDNMPLTDSVWELTPMEMKKIVLERRITIKMLLLPMCGLPMSGKTTLLRSLLRGADQSDLPKERVYRIPGFRMYEAIGRRDLTDPTNREIIRAVKQDAEAHTIATYIARLMSSQRQSIKALDRKDYINTEQLFDDPEMHSYHMATYEYLSDLIFQLERSDKVNVLARSELTVFNIYDVGMNKAVFEIFSLLVPHCKRVIQINALNLALYGTRELFCSPPQLSASPALLEKYSPRNDHQLMQLSPARDYFLRFVSGTHGYSKNTPRTILVGTHKDKIHSDEEVIEKKQNTHRLIRHRAEELGLAKVLHNDFIDINANDYEDNKKVKQAILDMIDRERELLEVDFPMNAGFLRCYLHNQKLMFISRERLRKHAAKINMDSEKKLEEFLEIFHHCGSLFCSLNGEIPFLQQYIILDPPAFIQEMDTLYYLEFHARSHPAGLESEVGNTKVGIVTERLAKKIWATKSDDILTTYQFCLRALEALKIIVPIDKQILPLELNNELQNSGDCYFMPTVRTEYKHQEKINPNSLYITYDTDFISFHKLSQFVEYLQTRHKSCIALKPCTFYNMVEFEWLVDQSQVSREVTATALDSSNQIVVATISIIFNSNTTSLSGAIEVTVDMVTDYETSNHKLEIYSAIKTACVCIFHQITNKMKSFQYKLAVPCPMQSTNPSKRQKRHLLPFQITRQDGVGMYCRECEQYTGVSEADRLLWVKAEYTGPSSYSIYANDILTPERLKGIAKKLVKHKPQEHLCNFIIALGKSKEGFYEVERQSETMAERIYRILLEWKNSRDNLSAIDLAIIMDSHGLFKEAVSLDPLVLGKYPKTEVTLSQS